MNGMPLHELLLGLAGRVDDDALAWARELVAVGEDGTALELLAGTLLAARAPVTPEEAAGLRRLFDHARADLAVLDALLDEVPAVDTVPARHRFVSDPPSGAVDPAGTAAAVTAAAARVPAAARVWLSWRLTPAGAVPGALPHPVVLAETTPGAPADVVAYHLADALARLGRAASVEAFAAGGRLPDYHRDALDAAELVHDSSATWREPEPEPELEAEPNAEPNAEPRPEAASEPDPEPGPAGEVPLTSRARHSRESGPEDDVFASVIELGPQRLPAAGPGPDDDDPTGPIEAPVEAAGPDEPGGAERELLRRLHEELARREGERGEGRHGLPPGGLVGSVNGSPPPVWRPGTSPASEQDLED